MRHGDLRRAQSLVETSDEIHRRTGDRWGQAQTVGTLAAIARDAGDRPRAAALFETSAALAREVGVGWWESGVLAELAALALSRDTLDTAESHARASLTIAERIGDHPGSAFGVGLFAAIAAGRDQRERACELWSAVDSDDAVSPLGGWRRHRNEIRMRAEEWIGALSLPEAKPALTLDEAVGRALRQSS
jgi:hypothetical protein